jgi:restriction system protein
MLLQAVIPLIHAFWWLIPVFAIIAILKTPFIKGAIGELQVNLAAKFFLDKNLYTLFKNVTLPTEDGSTQIDHIIVSRYGIFVIETKNMQGWIFGNARDKTWTQKIYRHTSKFQNPLRQNYKHTQTLQAALELDSDKLFSLIVFVGSSTFKTAMPDNVVYCGGYIRFIKGKTQSILNENEVLNICAKIQSGRLKPSIRTHIDHVNHVKSIQAHKQDNDSSCPKCGKKMVLRTTRNGNNVGNQFLGCSGYPRCKNIAQIT